MGLPVAPPLQSPSPIISAEPLQAPLPYSPAKPSSALSTPNLSQTDSCMSETFLLNNNPFSGSIHGAAMCPGTQSWSPSSAVQQLQAGSPHRQPYSPASSQLHQSRQCMPSPPPQLASLLHFQQQPQSLCQSSFLPGGLSSPLLSGTSSYSCASTGVPSLAMGHPVSPSPAGDQSLTNPLSQHQLPNQATATSAGSFEFEFDALCHPMPSMASNLSMTNSAPSAPLHDSSWPDPTSYPLGGFTQGLSVEGLTLAGPKGLFQASNQLPSFSQHCFRGSESSSKGQNGSQSPFTFVPAQCSSPSVFQSSAELPLSQSMQSQVLVEQFMVTLPICWSVCCVPVLQQLCVQIFASLFDHFCHVNLQYWSHDCSCWSFCSSCSHLCRIGVDSVTPWHTVAWGHGWQPCTAEDAVDVGSCCHLHVKAAGSVIQLLAQIDQ